MWKVHKIQMLSSVKLCTINIALPIKQSIKYTGFIYKKQCKH